MKKSFLFALLFFLGLSNIVQSQTCGGTFTDPAGPTSNYANSSDYIVTINPTNPGDKVTVTFTSFNTEATFDALYVFNGNSIAAPQITSANQAEYVPGGLAGGFWGTSIPGPFTSTSGDGSLTFRFRSDSTVSNPGWIANVTCSPPPSCSSPTTLSVPQVMSSYATLSWSQPQNPDTSSATVWQVLLLPAGSPAPTAATTGFLDASVNPFTVTGLMPNTCYTFYVRAVCSSTETTVWVGGYNFCTPFAPPVCGGQFTDSGGSNSYSNNENVVTTICPSNPGDKVTITFSSFATESTLDALYVFDGNSALAPQILSANGAGNVPGGVAGGFWGTTIPGPFTSSSTDGCLTFRFRSDSSGIYTGWIANITCGPPPTCLKPTALITTPVTSTSLSLGWTENSGATSWEVLALPCGSANPTESSNGTVVSTNPYIVSGLNASSCYSFYVRSICSETDKSSWSSAILSNDNCANAITITASLNPNCIQGAVSSLQGATSSVPPITTPCVGSADDDVWFKFVAVSPDQTVTTQVTSTPFVNLNLAIYSGSCGTLTQLYCSTTNQGNIMASNLTVGETYYVRVYSNVNIPQSTTFSVCITTPPTCSTASSVCGVTNYLNTINSPSLGTIGCLSTTPNASYFSLKIAASGSVNLLISQTDFTGIGRDIDYIAWGPFTSLDGNAACSAIANGFLPLTGLTTGCSYSTSPTEQFNIANAVAGEYYILLVTNFSNQAGYVNILALPSSTGSIDCSGIRLNAFLDTNNNGTQEVGEQNFPLGQFRYEVNNNNSVHNITSPSGIYTIYDTNTTNTYDLSYQINSDYSSMYTSSTTFSDITAASSGMVTYNFPVSIVQNYVDLGVTLVPQSSPRAGANYTVKIVYTNNGTQTIASGNLTFNNNVGTTITNVSETGTTPITNGFTYSFTNLPPFETRTIVVSIAVPSIPAVSLGQLLTNTVSIVPPSGDVVVNNNTSSSTQGVVGSYDPNDKIEGHGEKILFSSFTANDYLEYTIRFENNGTAAALNVLVNDVLDNKLDSNSLVMLAASHNYILDRLGNTLRWKFNNIQLPVSIPDTDTGKGFIKFKIKPKPNYAVGDIIPNTAEIYFDSNPAIVTNTFNTEFVLNLGTELFTENSIILYPNPANSLVQIALQNSIEIIDNIAVYDMLGKKVSSVYNVSSNQSTIDVSHLSKGIYLVEMATENHLKQIKKLIIQ